MQKKKENLLGRIVKKNYNNKLEEVLESKNFSEYTKSLLLNMLYKIETAYSDYKKAKHNIETKDEYIEKIISIIKKECNLIEVVRPNSPESQELGRRTFIVNKNQKTIKSYAIERKMLYALAKIEKKDLIVSQEKYGVFAKSISNLINIGSNINMVEPLRDFNGYSWTTITKEIESIEHNLVYQNLRILVGYQFLNAWVEKREFISDYMVMLKKQLSNRYGEHNANKIIELLYKISIVLENKYNPEEKENLQRFKNETLMQINQANDIGNFAIQISEKKKEINSKIRTIDKVLNDETLLNQEYQARTKYFPTLSMQELINQLIKEREKEFEKIEKLNTLLVPQNFIKYKKELENKRKYFELLDNVEQEKEIKKVLLKFQKIFLDCFAVKIQQAEEKLEIMELVYEFRYYYLLTFDIDRQIYEVQELQEKLEKIITLLLNKTKQEGITGIFTEKVEIENKIFKEVFSTRAIELGNIYMKITKEKNTIYLELYDEDSLEKRVELGTTQELTKKDLDIKLNKKFKVFY